MHTHPSRTLTATGYIVMHTTELLGHMLLSVSVQVRVRQVTSVHFYSFWKVMLCVGVCFALTVSLALHRLQE